VEQNAGDPDKQGRLSVAVAQKKSEPGEWGVTSVAARAGEHHRKTERPAGMHIAYLINQYPKVSHTFIRREILAAESLGVRITRIALRGWDAEVVDEKDRAELGRTNYVLKNGLAPLIAAVGRTAMARPKPFLAALRAAVAMSRKSVRPLPYHLVYLAHACYIVGLLRENGVSHIHAHFGTNTAEVAMLIRILGGPSYSFTVHGADEIDDVKNLGLSKKIAAAKFVVAISSYTRSQLIRYLPPREWEKIKVIHCGLEAEFFEESGSRVQSNQQFLCVGRFSREKAHLVLLNAFARLLEVYPDASLVLAGDGELRPQIESKIEELGIGRQVRITGWISSGQVREEILASRVLVLPSFQEGLPVVIMEAMALKRPVISTYIAGIPELVVPEATGWLVPAGDSEELSRAMAVALAAPVDELERMGAVARQRVLARHHIDSEVAKLIYEFGAP
jgi:colanic acid/amylovoran biosynthesis glycosyltransferase